MKQNLPQPYFGIVKNPRFLNFNSDINNTRKKPGGRERAFWPSFVD
jgi:hypothetical protein